MATAFISGYSLSSKTSATQESSVRMSLSDAGTMRFIDLGAVSNWVISAVFEVLTETEKDTLTDWLVANVGIDIDLPVGSNNYIGYIDPTQDISTETMGDNAPNLWVVKFSFRGVKQ